MPTEGNSEHAAHFSELQPTLVATGIASCKPKLLRRHLAMVAYRRCRHRNLMNQTLLTFAKLVHVVNTHCVRV
jgi:hypothetical protein